MMNGFEMHGIEHLSASSINSWVSQPALWVMERLLNKGAPVGVAAHRGSAIELGIERGLFYPDRSMDDCKSDALKEYDKRTALSGEAGVQRERAIIPACVEYGITELRQYGKPTVPENSRQHKVRVTIDPVPVPFEGYIDFLYDQHGILIDLKTEHRQSQSIKPSHARQVAIYQQAKPNHSARLAYVVPKKEPAVFELSHDQAQAALNQIREISARLERFLRLSKDPHELAGLLCPDPEHYYWNNTRAVQNRQDIYGY
jgi:hypothetical protein